MKRLLYIGMAGWFLTALFILWEFRLDYWDSFKFILQARSLTDPQFAFVAFDGWRPRGLVILLAGFNQLLQWTLHRQPVFLEYQCLMLTLSLFFFLVWKKVFSLLWGEAAARLGLGLLLLCQLFFHYSFSVLGDLYTGLFWGISLWLFLSGRPGWRRAVLSGLAGALCGLGKYQYLPLFPLFVVLWYRPKRNREIPAGAALLAFLVFAELLIRLSSPAGWGLARQLLEIRTQAIESLSWHTSPLLYAQALHVMYGVFFWIITAVVGFRVIRRKAGISEASLALGITTASLALVTQLYPHREVRYLIPLLPPLLGACAAVWVRWLKEASAGSKWKWEAVLVLALLWPAVRLTREAYTFLQDPIYDTRLSGVNGLWPQFRPDCRSIHSCLITIGGRATEFPEDPYYRSYDLGPQLSFFTGLPSTTVKCPDVISPSQLPPSFFAKADEGSCFLISPKNRAAFLILRSARGLTSLTDRDRREALEVSGRRQIP